MFKKFLAWIERQPGRNPPPPPGYAEGCRVLSDTLPMPTIKASIEDFSVTKIDVQAGDTVVLRTARHVDAETAGRIKGYAAAGFPEGVKILVLDPDLTLEVVRPEFPAQ